MGFLDALEGLVELGVTTAVGGEYGNDIGSFMEDGLGYYGLDVATPEGILDVLVNGQPEGMTELSDFLSKPTVAGGLGLIPGVGVQTDAVFTFLDGVVDLPGT